MASFFHVDHWQYANIKHLLRDSYYDSEEHYIVKRFCWFWLFYREESKRNWIHRDAMGMPHSFPEDTPYQDSEARRSDCFRSDVHRATNGREICFERWHQSERNVRRINSQDTTNIYSVVRYMKTYLYNVTIIDIFSSLAIHTNIYSSVKSRLRKFQFSCHVVKKWNKLMAFYPLSCRTHIQMRNNCPAISHQYCFHFAHLSNLL